MPKAKQKTQQDIVIPINPKSVKQVVEIPAKKIQINKIEKIEKLKKAEAKIPYKPAKNTAKYFSNNIKQTELIICEKLN